MSGQDVTFDGWCRLAFRPAPRWHHHLNCVRPPDELTMELAELSRLVRERSAWPGAYEHRTALMVAYHRALSRGEAALADELRELDSQLFTVSPQQYGQRVHYSDSPEAPIPTPPGDERPEYRCAVIAVTDWEAIPVGEIPFRLEGPDPHPTFTFRLRDYAAASYLGDGSLEQAAERLASNALSWLELRGGETDYETAFGVMRDGLARLMEVAPGGYVFGNTHWGDLLLERDSARDWAEAARLVTSDISWADLCHRLPERTRDRLIEALNGIVEDEDDHYDDDEGSHDETRVARQRELVETSRRWSVYLEEHGWPWLAQEQAYPPHLPPDAVTQSITTTLDGDYLRWENPDVVIHALNEHGIPCERDDDLIDRAMGPFGLSGWKQQVAASECACNQPRTWFCDCHPVPTLDGEQCPSCRTYQLVEIGYGLPSFTDGWPRDWYVGGCVIRGNDPVRACRACGLHLDAHGKWLRRTFFHDPTRVVERPIPTLEQGLEAIFLEASRLFGAPLSVSSGVLHELVPVGMVAGAWWSRIPGLADTCTCLGVVDHSSVLSSYFQIAEDDWARWVGDEWGTDTVGLLHVRSIEEPIGSILVRRPDGTTAAVEGPDGSGLMAMAIDYFEIAPSERVRAFRAYY